MNWAVVPRITGGLGCMLVLLVGILTGVDPLLCTIRGLIGGMVGWIAGALWASIMSHLLPPADEPPAAPTTEPTTTAEPAQPTETDDAEAA